VAESRLGLGVLAAPRASSAATSGQDVEEYGGYDDDGHDYCHDRNGGHTDSLPPRLMVDTTQRWLRAVSD